MVKVSIQMDPIKKVDISSDTTFALALEAKNRGHDLFYYETKNLSFIQGEIEAKGCPILELKKEIGNHVTLGNEESRKLKNEEIILMRQDPPFDMNYITYTHFLEDIHPNTLVVNNPYEVRNAPEKLFFEPVNPLLGLQSFQIRKLGIKLKLSQNEFANFSTVATNLFNVFVKYDCSLLEINPLVITANDDFVCLDAKIILEDDALFRHPDLKELRDPHQEDPLEAQAQDYEISYVKLDGNVGCLVNGAGLAMATMDIIKLHGGEPANFLDVGGVANAETVAHGFKIILSDKNVKSILINIFGGIVRCDRVAQGVIDALAQVEVNIPVVIRLEGTNAESGIGYAQLAADLRSLSRGWHMEEPIIYSLRDSNQLLLSYALIKKSLFPNPALDDDLARIGACFNCMVKACAKHRIGVRPLSVIPGNHLLVGWVRLKIGSIVKVAGGRPEMNERVTEPSPT